MPQLLRAAGLNTAAAYRAVEGITNSTIAATQAAVKEANVEAYHLIYLVAIAFGVVAIAASASVADIKPEQRSKEVAARLENDKVSAPEVKH